MAAFDVEKCSSFLATDNEMESRLILGVFVALTSFGLLITCDSNKFLSDCLFWEENKTIK